MSDLETKRKIVGLILFLIGAVIGTIIFAGTLTHLWLGYSGIALAAFGFLMAISGEGWLKL